VTLNGVKTFTGGVVVGQGALKMATVKPLGDLANTITVYSGGALDVNGRPWQATPIFGRSSHGRQCTGALLNSAAPSSGSSSLNVTSGGDSSIGVTGSGSLILGAIAAILP